MGMVGYRKDGSFQFSNKFEAGTPQELADKAAGIKRRNDLRDRVYKWYEEDRATQKPHRRHLGASDIGHACERHVFYTFRHALKKSFPGKTLRLFARGHREEPEIERDLKNIDIPITTTAGDGTRDQHNFSDPSGHSTVNLDGIIVENGRQMIIEMKTANKKSFDYLDKHGIRKAKPDHYAQIMYQALLASPHIRIDAALYVCVCKDDDRMHFEELEIDAAEQQRLLERATRVVNAIDIPMPLTCNENSGPCRYCDFKPICRDSRKDLIEKNCRSCMSARAINGAQWRCDLGKPFGTPCNEWHPQADL